MSKMTKYLFIVLVLVLFLGLTACERVLSGAEKDTVLAFSESTVDNLFEGWAAHDYAMFSRDFDADMQAEISASQFTALQQFIGNKLGRYIARRVDQVTRADEFYVVTYQAQFERAETVKIAVAFHRSNQSIAFLAFDTEQLSWSTFQ